MTDQVSDIQVTVTWTHIERNAGYEVRGGALASWTDVGNITTYTFTGLSRSTAYTLEVRGKISDRVSSGLSISVTTAASPLFADPTNVSISGVTRNAMTLSWTKASGATSYEVRQGDGDWSDVGDVDSRQFTGLSECASYTLAVRAKYAGGFSNGVSRVAATLAGTSAPPPLSRDSISYSDVRHNRLTLNWMKYACETTYEVIMPALHSTWINVGNVDSYTFTGLTPETRYTVPQIRARNAHGVSFGTVSRYLGSFSITTPPAPPARPDDDDDDGDDGDEPYVPPKTTPIPDTLNHLPPGIQVNNWVNGAQGKRVGAAGVGRADLIEQGILDAFDIWSNVTAGVEVCFNQSGRVVFLDAAYAPRKLFDLPAYQRDGMTCATIDSAGTVVLLRGGIPPPQQQPSQPQGANDVTPLATVEPSWSHSQMLSGCEVRPWANVKYRQSPPGGEVIGVTAIRQWLPASEKRYGYFKIPLWGREGWISGSFVYTRGDCGA